jgi:hypothetical protein
MYIHAVREKNRPMLKIATNAGARVKRHGSESEALLQLPAHTMTSQSPAFVDEYEAQADYRINLETAVARAKSCAKPAMAGLCRFLAHSPNG